MNKFECTVIPSSPCVGAMECDAKRSLENLKEGTIFKGIKNNPEIALKNVEIALRGIRKNQGADLTIKEIINHLASVSESQKNKVPEGELLRTAIRLKMHICADKKLGATIK